MDKLKQAGKLALLQEEPNLALFDEIQSVSEKLKGIQGVLKSINSKENKTYETELETLQNAILSLTECLQMKDMVVNVESNKPELDSIQKTLSEMLNESKKEQAINVKLVIK